MSEDELANIEKECRGKGLIDTWTALRLVKEIHRLKAEEKRLKEELRKADYTRQG